MHAADCLQFLSTFFSTWKLWNVRWSTQKKNWNAGKTRQSGTVKEKGNDKKSRLPEKRRRDVRHIDSEFRQFCPLTKSVVKNTFKREKKKRFKIFVRRKRINADKNNTHTNSTTHSRIKCYFSNNLYTIRFLWVLVSLRCRSYLFRGSAWNWKEKGSLKPWNDINQHRLHSRKDRG